MRYRSSRSTAQWSASGHLLPALSPTLLSETLKMHSQKTRKRTSASLVRFRVFWLCIFNVSDKSVGDRAGNKCPLALHCAVDLDDRYLILFSYRVRQHSDIPAMKEIQNPVIHRAQPVSQFVNAVSQQIGLGPS